LGGIIPSLREEVADCSEEGGNASTLQPRLDKVQWPQQYIVEKFSKAGSVFRELRLTNNSSFAHTQTRLHEKAMSSKHHVYHAK
jgi:hypothetical protein